MREFNDYFLNYISNDLYSVSATNRKHHKIDDQIKDNNETNKYKNTPRKNFNIANILLEPCTKYGS